MASRPAKAVVPGPRVPLGKLAWRDVRTAAHLARRTCAIFASVHGVELRFPPPPQSAVKERTRTSGCTARGNDSTGEAKAPGPRAPTPPTTLDSGAARRGSRTTGRSDAVRSLWLTHGTRSLPVHCGTFVSIACEGFTRNGSGWRPPLPPPQQPSPRRPSKSASPQSAGARYALISVHSSGVLGVQAPQTQKLR